MKHKELERPVAAESEASGWPAMSQVWCEPFAKGRPIGRLFGLADS